MKMKLTFDICHWMFGISFGDPINTLISIGPINIWFHNARKFQRMQEEEIRNRVMGE